MSDASEGPGQRPTGLQYARGDARRLLMLLAAVDRLPRPTLTTLAAATGHNKGTIARDVERLREQFGVHISKQGPVYRIEDWGRILRPAGVRELGSALRAP